MKEEKKEQKVAMNQVTETEISDEELKDVNGGMDTDVAVGNSFYHFSGSKTQCLRRSSC